MLDIAAKTELDALKIDRKKVVHKAAEVTRESIGNKIADKIVDLKSIIEKSSINFEQSIIPLESREDILSELRQVS